MSNALEALQSNDVAGCLELLKNEIRKAPSDPEKRVFLFQLYSIIGDWDKSLTQLNVARDLEPENKSMAETYQEVLRCESLRADVFSGSRSPMILGEPPEWIAKLLQALKYFSQADYDAFFQLQDEAYELAEPSAGTLYENKQGPTDDAEEADRIEGQQFEWIADADMRLGPVIEAIVNGNYYWIPMENIQSIELEAPVDLRDLAWTPATFCWKNKGQAVGFIPTRYPGSTGDSSGEILMARTTEWETPAEELYVGKGLRILNTDSGEFPLTQIRRIVFGSPEAESESE